MNQEDHKLLRQFYKILDRAIRACYRRDGQADLETVCAEMERDSEFTLEELAPKFGRRHMRILAQKRLKRLAMNNGHPKTVKAAVAAAASVDQLELDIENIEQFRGAPISISLEIKQGHVIYIPFADSLRDQRRRSLELLDRSIAADIHKRQTQARVTQFADFLADLYGDRPVKELIGLWDADGRPGKAAGAGGD